MGNTERRTRPDRARETIVSADIIMADIDGPPAAAKFLERERVPFSVIVSGKLYLHMVGVVLILVA